MPETLQVPTMPDAISSSPCMERRNIQLFRAEYELAVKIAEIIKENLYKGSSDTEEICLCAVRSFIETMINNWRR